MFSREKEKLRYARVFSLPPKKSGNKRRRFIQYTNSEDITDIYKGECNSGEYNKCPEERSSVTSICRKQT